MNEEILEETKDDELLPEAESATDDVQSEDYEALIEKDLDNLRESFPELKGISDISELENPVRYGALRDLGLSPEEAYRATTTRTRVTKSDNRAHLRSSVPRAAASQGAEISYRDMETAREIFSGLSDTEIQRLFRKVTR